ncbi:MAG: inositol 2-dehydrogenase, partial [Candidatus Competibacteraceae bacterium]|nr:inositol 2-dehydrogenase [Candidatus Competibacteraceae bacterium]
EKPIDLDINRVNRCWDEIKHCNVPIQLGFNRRYDPSHRAVAEAVRNGEVGQLEMVIISSRDPAPPPADYIKVSGGLLRDMMIHDFDLARFVLGEEPVEVFAMASNKVDPMIGQLGDIDTAMVTLTTASGILCHINNSRRAVYGYDQRLEAFGSLGMVRSNNQRATTLTRHTAEHSGSRDPLLHFFIERYQQAYQAEINDFIAAIAEQRTPTVSFEDGRRALLLADAAYESLRTGRKVAL